MYRRLKISVNIRPPFGILSPLFLLWESVFLSGGFAALGALEDELADSGGEDEVEQLPKTKGGSKGKKETEGKSKSKGEYLWVSVDVWVSKCLSISEYLNLRVWVFLIMSISECLSISEYLWVSESILNIYEL